MVAGGGELISDSMLPQYSYTIEGKNFTHDFHILPLKGYDVILGANWLKKFSPNFLDWQNKSISIFLPRGVVYSDGSPNKRKGLHYLC
jgi:hypothetical protein